MVTKGTTKTLNLEMKAWVWRKLFSRKPRMTGPAFADNGDSVSEQVVRNDRINSFVLQMLEYRFGKLDKLTTRRVRFLSEDLLFALGDSWAILKSRSDLKRWLIAREVKHEK